jgi:hypothetical protein
MIQRLLKLQIYNKDNQVLDVVDAIRVKRVNILNTNSLKIEGKLLSFCTVEVKDMNEKAEFFVELMLLLGTYCPTFLMLLWVMQ